MKRNLDLRRRVTAAGVVAGLATALLFAMPGAGAQAGVQRNGEVVADGSWCWFQDPRAVHFVHAHDRTYVGYVTSTGDVDVISQDAGTARLTHTTLHPRLQADDHAAPGLVVLPDRRIAVFYSPHTGERMFYRISLRPEDISAFGPELTIRTNTGSAVGYTYANPIYLPAEKRLYLFFRGGNSLPSVTWSTDFVTWADAVTLAVTDHTQAFTRPYAKYATNGNNTIGIAFTTGHPDEQRDANGPNSVYEVTLRGGVLYTPDGAPLSVLVPSAGSDPQGVPHTGAAHTDWLDTSNGGLVYQDPGDAPAWLESTAFDNGNPIIVYSTYQQAADAQYRYARWTNGAWADVRITDAGGPIESNDASYSGAADIDRNHPGTVYLSRETRPTSGVWEVEQWQVTDDMAIRVAVLPQDLTQKNVRPVVPWGPPGEVNVLWMSGRYDDWAAGYHTQLRELTRGRAPTTVRSSASSAVIKSGTTVTISGRVVQGINGKPVARVLVELVGHTAGRPDQLLQRAYADATGLATFTRRPDAATRFTIQVALTAAWGAAVSPSQVVNVVRAPGARISVSARTLRRGQSVVVGLRAIDTQSGGVLAGTTLELWQQVSGRAWELAGHYTTARTGLVTVTRSPGLNVVYQARAVAGSADAAAFSTMAAVQVS